MQQQDEAAEEAAVGIAGNPTRLVLAIVLPLASAVLLVILGFSCWQKSRKQNAPLKCSNLSAGLASGALKVADQAQAVSLPALHSPAPPEQAVFANPLAGARVRE